MKITYSPTADALYIQMNNHVPASVKRVMNGFNVDLDAEGHIIGIELLDASQFVENLDDMDYEMLTVSQKPSESELAERRAAIREAKKLKKADKI